MRSYIHLIKLLHINKFIKIYTERRNQILNDERKIINMSLFSINLVRHMISDFHTFLKEVKNFENYITQFDMDQIM